MKKHIPLAITLLAATAAAAARPPVPPELHKLDVSVGRWIFHGTSLATPFSKAGTWTWHENCRWSSNRLFLVCTFDNVWSGKAVRSLVVDTWNSKDKAYWHYEFFAAGAGGERPFVSKMTVHGNTWTEYGESRDGGGKRSTRIVYRFVSPAKVTVSIEASRDGRHWTAIARGTGRKRK